MFFFFFAAQALVNFIGAFGPELGFDALWYHLTLPKLYALAGQIYHVPGGLLYYSEMPRLTEILYLFLPSHFVSWAAGIGSAVVLYLLCRHLGLSRRESSLCIAIFYVTPLVGWQSGSSYVDLTRTFFETLAFYLVLAKRPAVAGLAAGLAISTKTLALGSLVPLLLFVPRRRVFLLTTLLVAFPWFLSAYLNTGYPFYPIGAGILDATHQFNWDFWNLPKILGDFWRVFVTPGDPISPIYLIATPFLWPAIKKFPKLAVFCLLSIAIWYVTPRTGGGRFLLPYLPPFAILIGWVVSRSRILLAVTIFLLSVNLTYRLGAVSRLAPLFLGRQTQTEYLCRNLDLKVTYVNCHNFRPTGLVLVKGYHNLYYINFPFIHETWYRGEKYTDVIAP